MMTQFSDEQLVQEYTATGSDAAFTELVRRHGDMVHSIAARLVDWDTARDVSQRVFLTLAKKAGRLAKQAKQYHEATQSLAQELAAAQQQADELRGQLANADRKLVAEKAKSDKSQAASLEVMRLRQEVTRLRADLTAAKGNTETEKTWTARSVDLKTKAESAPGMKIPEMGIVTQMDWLDATKQPVVTEEDHLQAFSNVRDMVEGRFASYVYRALKKHMGASDGNFPATVEELAPLFDPPLDPSFLVRWKVVAVTEGDLEDSETVIWCTPVDPDLDTHWGVDKYGPRSARSSPVKSAPQ